MEPVHKLAKLMMMNNKIYIAIITHELSKCGITIPQALVLDAIKDGPKMIGEISKLIDLSYSTVSGIIDRLERQQMVKRHRDENDRRVVWVSITEHFHEMERDYPILNEENFSHAISQIFREISKEQIDMLQQSLILINENLERKLKILQCEKGSEAI